MLVHLQEVHFWLSHSGVFVHVNLFPFIGQKSNFVHSITNKVQTTNSCSKSTWTESCSKSTWDFCSKLRITTPEPDYLHFSTCCYRVPFMTLTISMFDWWHLTSYLFQVKNRNIRTRCQICSKLTIKTPERRQSQ